MRILETRVFGGEKWYAKRDVKAKRPDPLLSGYHIGSEICAYAKFPESSWRYSRGRGLELIFGSSDYRFHAALFYLAYSNRSDSTLPNSLLLAMALWKAGIPVELHVYPEGVHGLSLANELVECLDGRGVQEECTSWISLVDTWLDRLMKKEGEE